MKNLTILHRMEQLIYHESTGTPAEFAQKLEISKRSLYNYLKMFKEFGADIRYNQHRRSYEYANQKRLLIKIEYK